MSRITITIVTNLSSFNVLSESSRIKQDQRKNSIPHIWIFAKSIPKEHAAPELKIKHIYDLVVFSVFHLQQIEYIITSTNASFSEL